MKKEKKKGSCLVTCLAILAVICLFPLIAGFGWIAGAIWLIFFKKRMKDNPARQKKYTIGVSAVSALSLFIFIYSVATTPPSPTSLTLSSPVYGQALEIDSDYVVNIQYEPANASLSTVTYRIDDPSLADVTSNPDDPSLLTLHTKGEGTVSITAVKNSIESNTLSFEIIDSVRIEQEKASEAEKLQTEEEKTVVDSIISEKTESEPSAESEQKDEDPLGFSVMFSKTYRNDATGNWRLARIAEDVNIEEYALDYYKNYFESDNEIHIIINSHLNTTTRVTVIGNLLDVATMEYVDKEEHDAALSCSGTLLSEYHVNTNTGKIEEIKASDTVEPQSGADIATENHINDTTSTDSGKTIVSNAETPAPEVQTEPTLPENNPQPEETSTVETPPASEPEVSTPVGDMVWLSATGSKYHRINNCGRMNPNKARQVSLEDAINMGYEKCSKCY